MMKEQFQPYLRYGPQKFKNMIQRPCPWPSQCTEYDTSVPIWAWLFTLSRGGADVTKDTTCKAGMLARKLTSRSHHLTQAARSMQQIYIGQHAWYTPGSSLSIRHKASVTIRKGQGTVSNGSFPHAAVASQPSVRIHLASKTG